MTAAAEARKYLRAHHLGVLATYSKSVPGYPFASVVPFVTDHACRPILLTSRLAEHTRSLEADRRASLIVHDFSVADQAGPRLTIIGEAERCDDEAATSRYLRYLPESRQFLGLGDFSFWRLVPRQALFIRGFGRIEWVQAKDFDPPENSVDGFAVDVLRHMNQDHADALLAYCQHVHAVTPGSVQMIGIDCDGFDVHADGRILRFEFAAPVLHADDARKALVALAQQARNG